MNRAQVRWHRLKCLVRCIGQFALAANQRSAGEVTLFEPQSWHHHKLERFQHAYNKDQEHRSDVDLKLLMEVVQSMHVFAHASYTSKLCKEITIHTAHHQQEGLFVELDFCRHMQVVVLHDGQVVYHQGDPIDGASGVYVVLEGIVSSYKNAAYDYSDKAYPAWHQATYPSEDVQFGTCETTATTGDTFGNTAVNGCLCRDTTILAQSSAKVVMLSQSDYRRILAHNNDTMWTPRHCLYAIETEPPHRTPRQVRDLIEFLLHFQYFRSLPRDAVEALCHRLRHRTFKAHEVLSRQGDPDVPLVICVAGKVLLYVQDSVEESRCRLLGPQNASAPASSGTITKKSGTNAASALTDNLEYDPGLGWCVGELGDGESFGEQAVASGGVQSATLRAAYTTTAIVLNIADVEQIVAQYDNVDPPKKSDEVVAHLTALLATAPRVRTAGMVRDIAKALRRCDAGLFFQQLGQYALETMAQEAAVRVVDAGTIVLQQDHTCEYMYIVLNGSINIHRLTARRKQRRQSSIIHMELHQHKLPDDSHPPTPHGTTRDGADTSASLGTETFDKCGQFLSSLGVGGAFGHVPILTNSHSQSSYVVARNLAKGTLTAMLLCVPARFVAALLQRYDDSLLYNPRQVLDQATKPKHDRQNALKFANFLCTKAAFAAMPQRTLHRLLESMQVVDIPFNHLLWDQGERLGHGVVVVLAGSVLLVRSGHRPTLVDQVPKPADAGTHPRLVLHVGRTANTVTLMHSHDQVHSCGPGDCIGSMRIDDSENNTIVTTDTAMTLTGCKVAIIQWPRVYVAEPYVAKLCNDLLDLHATHLKRQQEQLQQVPLEGESPPLAAPATSDDVHAAIGNLLSAIEWKDKFPVRVQGCIAELFTFAVYSSNDISTKS